MLNKGPIGAADRLEGREVISKPNWHQSSGPSWPFSRAMRALLARCYGPDWLKSPSLLDILCLDGMREVIEAVKPEDTARAFAGDCGLFSLRSWPTIPPGLEAYA